MDELLRSVAELKAAGTETTGTTPDDAVAATVVHAACSRAGAAAEMLARVWHLMHATPAGSQDRDRLRALANRLFSENYAHIRKLVMLPFLVDLHVIAGIRAESPPPARSWEPILWRTPPPPEGALESLFDSGMVYSPLDLGLALLSPMAVSRPVRKRLSLDHEFCELLLAATGDLILNNLDGCHRDPETCELAAERISGLVHLLDQAVTEDPTGWSRRVQDPGRHEKGLPVAYSRDMRAQHPDPGSLLNLLGKVELAMVRWNYDPGIEASLRLTAEASRRLGSALRPGGGDKAQVRAAALLQQAVAKGANAPLACDGSGIAAASTKELKKCGRCKVAWYCSVDCQRASWAEHKKTCFVASDS